MILYKDNEIKIFPDPAKDNINVTESEAFGWQPEFAVYDRMGKKVLNSTGDCDAYSRLSFNISALESGVYFFSIKNKHDTFTKKFSVIR